MTKLHYVYADVSDCGNVYYVGAGNYDRAFNSMKRYKTKGHAELVERFGQNRKVICCTPDRDEAHDIERALIAEYKLNKLRHPENPWACQAQDGGPGASGLTINISQKQRMAEAKRNAIAERGTAKYSEAAKRRGQDAELMMRVSEANKRTKNSPEYKKAYYTKYETKLKSQIAPVSFDDIRTTYNIARNFNETARRTGTTKAIVHYIIKRAIS